jgi:hypothetical protein
MMRVCRSVSGIDTEASCTMEPPLISAPVPRLGASVSFHACHLRSPSGSRAGHAEVRVVVGVARVAVVQELEAGAVLALVVDPGRVHLAADLQPLQALVGPSVLSGLGLDGAVQLARLVGRHAPLAGRRRLGLPGPAACLRAQPPALQRLQFLQQCRHCSAPGPGRPRPGPGRGQVGGNSFIGGSSGGCCRGCVGIRHGRRRPFLLARRRSARAIM